jgi:hypothetical protein
MTRKTTLRAVLVAGALATGGALAGIAGAAAAPSGSSTTTGTTQSAPPSTTTTPPTTTPAPPAGSMPGHHCPHMGKGSSSGSSSEAESGSQPGVYSGGPQEPSPTYE